MAVSNSTRALYPKLGKLVYFLSFPLLMVYSTHQKRPRVRGFIVLDNKVLLVRNCFGNQKWVLPGGGVKRGETDKQALARELHEELGMSISQQDMKFLGMLTYGESVISFKVNCYYIKGVSKLRSEQLIPNFELIDTGWFPVNNLPIDSGNNLKEAYALYNSHLKS